MLGGLNPSTKKVHKIIMFKSIMVIRILGDTSTLYMVKVLRENRSWGTVYKENIVMDIFSQGETRNFAVIGFNAADPASYEPL